MCFSLRGPGLPGRPVLRSVRCFIHPLEPSWVSGTQPPCRPGPRSPEAADPQPELGPWGRALHRPPPRKMVLLEAFILTPPERLAVSCGTFFFLFFRFLVLFCVFLLRPR